LIHKFKKSELDCKNLRIRLNAKLEKVQKRKYNFCLNTEKIISDFYDDNKVKSKDKNAFKKRFETNLAILEKENKSLKNSLFAFKDSLIDFLESVDIENNSSQKNDKNKELVLFDLGDYSNLPYSAYGDLFDDGIKSGLEVIKNKLEKVSKETVSTKNVRNKSDIKNNCANKSFNNCANKSFNKSFDNSFNESVSKSNSKTNKKKIVKKV